MKPILATVGLSKSFGSIAALSSVDFELRPGAITARAFARMS